MKKLIIATIALLFVVGMTVSSYAATDQIKVTSVNATVGEIFELELATAGVAKTPGEKARSSTVFSFKTVDGSATWYYNSLATLGGGTGGTDPSDGKSDVALVLKSNIDPYYLKISKASDSLDGKIGYEVGGAFDGGSETAGTATDGTVAYPTGFAGSTGTGKDGWGELPTTSTLVYTSGTQVYATYGVVIPISYTLVPIGLSAAGSPYSTTITYTLTQTL